MLTPPPLPRQTYRTEVMHFNKTTVDETPIKTVAGKSSVRTPTKAQTGDSMNTAPVESSAKKPRLELEANAGKEKQKDKDDKKKKALTLKNATSLKDRMLKATAVSSNLIASVETDAAYEWARNPVQLGRLQAVANTVAEKTSSDPFFKYWLTTDTASARTAHQDDLPMLLTKFLQACTESVDAMEREHGRFMKMHRASS